MEQRGSAQNLENRIKVLEEQKAEAHKRMVGLGFATLCAGAGTAIFSYLGLAEDSRINIFLGIYGGALGLVTGIGAASAYRSYNSIARQIAELKQTFGYVAFNGSERRGHELKGAERIR